MFIHVNVVTFTSFTPSIATVVLLICGLCDLYSKLRSNKCIFFIFKFVEAFHAIENVHSEAKLKCVYSS